MAKNGHLHNKQTIQNVNLVFAWLSTAGYCCNVSIKINNQMNAISAKYGYALYLGIIWLSCPEVISVAKKS